MAYSLSKSIKYSKQSINLTKRVLGTLKNIFEYKGLDLVKQLYTCYVRPHLEFAVPAWSPYQQKDIETLEKVQRRATKIASESKGKNYKSRLADFDLQPLFKRKIRGDLIEMYKINNDLDKINWYKKPKVSTSLEKNGPAGGILCLFPDPATSCSKYFKELFDKII